MEQSEKPVHEGLLFWDLIKQYRIVQKELEPYVHINRSNYGRLRDKEKLDYEFLTGFRQYLFDKRGGVDIKDQFPSLKHLEPFDIVSENTESYGNVRADREIRRQNIEIERLEVENDTLRDRILDLTNEVNRIYKKAVTEGFALADTFLIINKAMTEQLNVAKALSDKLSKN